MRKGGLAARDYLFAADFFQTLPSRRLDQAGSVGKG